MANLPHIDGVDDLVEVGHGGTAVVYRGVQRNFGRTVAVKVLNTVVSNEQQRLRFERECLAIGALSSQPNIVTVYSAGVTESAQPYLVMEYLPHSLADVLAEQGRLPWQQACALTLALADAASAAHAQRVIHRDIKPENVLMSETGTPKLTDFGLARMIGSFESQTNTVRASITHASPELIEGRAVTETTDVYSLASTLHHLIAGAAPFVRPGDESLIAIIGRTLREAPPSLNDFDVPPEVERVIVRAMSKDSANRPSSMAGFAAELAEASGVSAYRSTTGMVPIVERKADVQEPPRRRRAPLLIAGAVVLALGAASVVAYAMSDDNSSAATDLSVATTPDTDPSTSTSSSLPASTTVAPTTAPSSSVPSTSSAPAVTSVATTIPSTVAVVVPTVAPPTTVRPRVTPTTQPPPPVTTAAPPVTAAPTTTPPPPPSTTPPTVASTKQVPNVVGSSPSGARAAIVDQAGFAGVSVDQSCDTSSNVVDYSPKGQQPLSAVITVFCGG